MIVVCTIWSLRLDDKYSNNKIVFSLKKKYEKCSILHESRFFFIGFSFRAATTACIHRRKLAVIYTCIFLGVVIILNALFFFAFFSRSMFFVVLCEMKNLFIVFEQLEQCLNLFPLKTTLYFPQTLWIFKATYIMLKRVCTTCARKKDVT